MITDITHTTVTAIQSSMMISEMLFPNTSQESYERVRPEAVALLTTIEGFEDFELPLIVKELHDDQGEVLSGIMKRLSVLRSQVNGDVLPLTFFMLTYCICRGAIFVAFGNEDAWQHFRLLLRTCFEELGLDWEEEIAVFETRARSLVRPDGQGDTFVEGTDRVYFSAEFLKRVFGKVYDRWSSPTGLADQIAELVKTVDDFRRESHAEHEEILESIASLHNELVERLIKEGVEPAQAEALGDIESEGFLSRLRRWSTSQAARDALEAALWAALDFVPAGTGVKLGLKVLAAVRRSVKK